MEWCLNGLGDLFMRLVPPLGDWANNLDRNRLALP